MKFFLEQVSRYWQLRVVAVVAGIALVVYAVLLPSHENSENDSTISAVSASQLGKTERTSQPSPLVAAARATQSVKSPANPDVGAVWQETNQAAAEQLNLTADDYSQGEFPRDFSESIRHLRRAASEGDPTAQLLLGHAYESGLGVPKDLAEMARLYTHVAEAHASGKVSADAPVNYSQALESYQKAAELGDESAELYLGLVNDMGDGGPRNVFQAVRWYRKAAAQGSASAACNLGLLYHSGDGVPKDNVEAAAWLGRAAARGSASAQYGLGQMYAHGEGVERNDSTAAALLEQAAKQRNARAQVVLSAMYASGRGVPESTAKAYMWVNLASASELSARDSRDRVEKLIPPETIAEGQRLTHDWLQQHGGTR